MGRSRQSWLQIASSVLLILSMSLSLSGGVQGARRTACVCILLAGVAVLAWEAASLVRQRFARHPPAR